MMLPEQGTPILETARLVLRTFAARDLNPMVEMNANPAVMAYLGGPRAPESTLAMMQAVNEGFPARGLGFLAVERRADGATLGMAGLSRLSWFSDDVEVGWRLRPEHWGWGYATEAGMAWISHAFTRSSVSRVISVADVPNARSMAVMRRLGMRLDHVATLRDGDEVFEAEVHAISRGEWTGRP